MVRFLNLHVNKARLLKIVYGSKSNGSKSRLRFLRSLVSIGGRMTCLDLLACFAKIKGENIRIKSAKISDYNVKVWHEKVFKRLL
jgi:hypothetical protein